jgi:hypothetical protein
MERERSEDAVSWNVFRYLEKAGLLTPYLDKLSGMKNTDANLVYWSYDRKAKTTHEPLSSARNAFGEDEHRGSEPDLIVETNECLFFIEAKFGSGNSTEPSRAGRVQKYIGGGGRWFEKAFVPGSDLNNIAEVEKLYELMRLWLLGSWASRQKGKEFFLVNLVIEKREKKIVEKFGPHINDSVSDGVGVFMRETWEDIYRLIDDMADEGPGKEKITEFFRGKTLGYSSKGKLQRAFSL